MRANDGPDQALVDRAVLNNIAFHCGCSIFWLGRPRKSNFTDCVTVSSGAGYRYQQMISAEDNALKQPRGFAIVDQGAP
jgi:hypothetical protein